MAYEGWFEFNDTEIINAGRTVELASVLGIDAVRLRRSSVGWIEAAFDIGTTGFGDGDFGLGPFGIGDGDAVDYRDVTEAPWYDARFSASAQFAGLVPLSVRGLEGSTLSAETSEYITDGGLVGKGRHSTRSIVVDAVLVGRSEEGVEYGLRWLNRTLRTRPFGTFCAGSDLTYFRYASAESPKAHRRDVRLTRPTSVTLKRSRRCSTLWRVTFTLTSGDPFEYGDPVLAVSGLGGASPTLPIPGSSSGQINGLTEVPCPEYDYSPIYDPAYPALVPSPTAPNFLPEGWGIETGMTFTRYWARVPSPPPSLDVVPLVSLASEGEARRLRVSVWPSESLPTDLCGSAFSAVINYLPAFTSFYVDGEQQAAYAWDGVSPLVQRTDSLVFSRDGGPVQWATTSDPEEFLVTLDVFEISPGVLEGGGTVRMDVSFIPKSD